MWWFEAKCQQQLVFLLKDTVTCFPTSSAWKDVFNFDIITVHWQVPFIVEARTRKFTQIPIAPPVWQRQWSCVLQEMSNNPRERAGRIICAKRSPNFMSWNEGQLGSRAARVSPLKFYKCYGKVYKHLWARCVAISFSKITPKPSGAKPDRFPQAWPCQALLFQVDVGHIYIYIYTYVFICI